MKTRGLVLALAFGLLAAATGTAVAVAQPESGTTATATTPGSCVLGRPGNKIQHVIYLTFDNVHFTRDNPNVPSDLEQMPHLRDFLTSNGTLDDNHHTPLIAHTGTDILTQLTGQYGDNMGQPISNSYRYYGPDGTSNTGVSFAYWTDGVFDPKNPAPADSAPTMTTPQGKIAPAPWVPFTRAGCDVGAVATANTVLENTGPDVPKVFGAASPEAAEAKADPDRASTDFDGIGVHCAAHSALCAKGSTRPDLLPDEPGGYQGYPGLFGAKYVNPAISPSHPVTAVDGTTPITDSAGRPGFPGFDGMSAANSLGYVAAMQEAGVPVTFGYISDAHDRHPGNAYGPGEAGYVAALKSYDTAFARFFERLRKDGIDQDNSLFVVTSDENDHFVGGVPSPANCDGVHTPCTYRQIGEINANVRGELATQRKITTPFQVHADSAPNFYLDGNPARTASTTRDLEHGVAALTAQNPITGRTDTWAQYFADPVEMKLLHMVTGDPLRTPTFTTFADPNYYVYAGAPNCASPCVALGPGYAWNHGDFAKDINMTFVGLAGAGVRKLGVTDSVWSDHTDIRPTVLTMLGLKDDYSHDGRPLFEFVDTSALPVGLRGHKGIAPELGATFKQLNASVGEFGSATLAASTTAITSTTPGDARYAAIENRLAQLGVERAQVAGEMRDMLERAAFDGGKIDQRRAAELIARGRALIEEARQAGR